MSTPQRYRKKPVEVDAWRFTGDNGYEVMDWIADAGHSSMVVNGALVIRTLEGEMRADPGDWVIKGVASEFYPCKPGIFEQTYEPA